MIILVENRKEKLKTEIIKPIMEKVQKKCTIDKRKNSLLEKYGGEKDHEEVESLGKELKNILFCSQTYVCLVSARSDGPVQS